MDTLINLVGDDEEMSVALLKSSFVFGFSKDAKNSRKQLIEKTILAVVLKIGEATVDDVVKFFSDNFGKIMTVESVTVQLETLKNKRYLEYNDSKYRLSEKSKKESNDVESVLSKQTGELIDKICSRTISDCKINVSMSEKKQMYNNVKNALESYYRLWGIDYFSNNRRPESELNSNSIIQNVRKNLKEEIADYLVYNIGITLKRPTKEERDVLEKWAKIFVYIEVAQLDPALSSFELTKLRDKSFVLDTDVVLHCVSYNSTFSQQYKTMVKSLVDNGCKVIVPQRILHEVYKHLESSKKQNSYLLSTYGTIDEDIIEEKITNVFVEDYYRIILKDPTKYADFNVYLENLYDEEDPYRPIVMRLEEVLGKKIVYDEDDIICKNRINFISESDFERFVKEIFYETRNTPKAMFRSDDENMEISETDALVYLSISQLMEDAKSSKFRISNSGKNAMDNSMYFVTTSTRADKCAKKFNINHDVLTNPNVLISILYSIGIFDMDKSSVISLFDNPFLADVAESNWECLRNLSEFGYDLRGANAYNITKKLNAAITTWITDRDDESFNNVVSKSKELNLSYSSDSLAASKLERKNIENEQLVKRNEQLVKQNEQLMKQNEQLKHDRAESDYKKRAYKSILKKQ